MLLILAIIFLGLFFYACWETYQVECTHWTLQKEDKQEHTAPNGFTETKSIDDRPLKLLFFSDIHTRHFSIKMSKVIARIAQEDFDLCIIGGDFLTRYKFRKKALCDLKLLCDHLQKRHIPCLAVAGNHDVKLLPSLENTSDLRFLDNREMVFTDKLKRNWLLYGTSDLKTGTPSWERLKLIRTAGLPNCMAKILIAHNPDTIILAQKEYPQADFDYFLSGHFHGGQVNLPCGLAKLEFLLLRSETLGRQKHVKGSFNWGRTRCFISRGLGTVLLPFRFRSKPELAIIHLYQTKDQSS